MLHGEQPNISMNYRHVLHPSCRHKEKTDTALNNFSAKQALGAKAFPAMDWVRKSGFISSVQRLQNGFIFKTVILNPEKPFAETDGLPCCECQMMQATLRMFVCRILVVSSILMCLGTVRVSVGFSLRYGRSIVVANIKILVSAALVLILKVSDFCSGSLNNLFQSESSPPS